MKNKIKKITIENFRKFNHLEIEFKEDESYYAIAGPNAVGKTSVLEAINIAFSTRTSKFTEIQELDFFSTEPIMFIVELEKPFYIEFNDGFKRLIPCKKFTKTVSYREDKERMKIFSSEYDVQINYNPETYSRRERNINKEEKLMRKKRLLRRDQHILRSFTEINDNQFEYTIESDDQPRTWEHLGYKYFTTVQFPETFYFDNNRERELVSGYRTVFSNIIEELEWRYKKKFVENTEPREKGLELKQIIDEADDYKENLLKDSKRLLGESFNLPFDEENLDFYPFDWYQPYRGSKWGTLSDNERIVTTTQLGAGLSNIISLSLSVSFANKTKEPVIFLIDEPELHLETKLKKELFQMLESLDSQVIIATHSPHFIDQATCTNTIILEEVENDIKLNYGNEIRVSDLLFRIYSESFDDLLLPEKVLIVEGKYDKKLIQKGLDLLNKTDKQIQIIKAGSKDRIPNKSEEFKEVIETILAEGKWYSDSIRKVLKIVVDADVATSTTSGWATAYSLDEDKQIMRVPSVDNEDKCIEYIYPESLVMSLVESCETKLTDDSMLKDKSKEEIVEIILSDNNKDEEDKRQAENPISKQRLNEYVTDHITEEILQSEESVDLKELIEWICKDID